jgi:hypothetical protein
VRFVVPIFEAETPAPADGLPEVMSGAQTLAQLA